MRQEDKIQEIACADVALLEKSRSRGSGGVRTVEAVGGRLYRKGWVLLGKRSLSRDSFPGVWDIPGGHREPDEPSDAALHRELAEDTGIVVSRARPLSIIRYRLESGAPIAVTIFLVTGWNHEPVNLCTHEHDELRWFPVEEARALDLASPKYPKRFVRAASEVGC